MPELLGAPRLFEREAEGRAMADLVDRAVTGAGGLVIVRGPAGIGKTALLAHFGNVAASGEFTTLRARCLPLEGSFAFGVARQLFEPVLRTATPEQRAELLGGAGGLAESVIEGSTGGTAPVAVPDGGDAARHGLFWLTANLSARSPVSVVVDDAHWADDPSLEWLLHLANRVSELPAVVVLALRAGDPGAKRPALLEIVGLPETLVLEPRPLGLEATRELVSSVVGDRIDESTSRACHTVTDGNPFLLRELGLSLAQERASGESPSAQSVAQIAPAGIAVALERRLARLPAQTLELARAVAVLGGEAAAAEAALVAGVDVVEVPAARDALVAQDVLEAGPSMTFVHPILRAAIEQAIPPGHVTELHGRAVEVLRATGAAAERIAAHHLAVPPGAGRAAADDLHAAADAALGRGAPAIAVTFLRRALEEPRLPASRRAALLHSLGIAEMSDRLPEAPDHLRQALDLADPAERPRLASQAAYVLGIAGDHVSAVGICRTGLAADPEPILEARLRSDLAVNAWAKAALAAEGRTVVSPGASAPTDERAHPHLRTAACLLRMMSGYSLEPLVAAVSSLLDQLEEDPGTLTLTVALLQLAWADHLDPTRLVLERLVRRSREAGSPNSVAHYACFRGLVALRAGRLADAEADLWESVEFNLPLARPEGMSWPLAWLLTIACLRTPDPRLPEADAILGPAVEDWFGSAVLIEQRAALATNEGQPEYALSLLDQAEELWAELGVSGPPIASWRLERALALLKLGHADEATAFADEHATRARAAGATRDLGRALHASGLARGYRPMLEDAIELLAPVPGGLDRARALADLGDIDRRAGKRAKARQPLREALDIAHRCGADRLAASIEQRLRMAGARPRRPALSGAGALTPAEHRAATLAAQGLSNREIAQALFVTTNTVETHMRHIFQKLDITTRTQIADHL